MSETTQLTLPNAASQLGVPVRLLRHAIRTGTIPAPAGLTATSTVSQAWVDSTRAAAEATPKILNRSSAQKVPPFARYAGTSAWRKYRARVREYNAFRAGTAG